MEPACTREQCKEEAERKATWIELFFDLVFVVGIASVASYLHHHLNVLGLLRSIFLLSILWLAWSAATFYADRFDSDDPFHRACSLLQMIAVAFLAAHMEGAFHPEKSSVFALCYVAVRSVVFLLYLRVAISIPHTRGIAIRLLIGSGLVIALWSLSAFVISPARMLLWMFALGIDLSTPLLSKNALSQSRAKLSSTHLPERFGLFTILVLGESIAAVVAGVHSVGLTSQSLWVGILGLAIAFFLWWSYFENMDLNSVNRSFGYLLKWEYAHLPLITSIAFLGVGIHQALEHPHLSAQVTWLLCGSFSVAYFMIGFLHLICLNYDSNPPCKQKTALRFLAALIALSLGFWGNGLSTILVLGVLAGLGLVQLIHDVIVED